MDVNTNIYMLYSLMDISIDTETAYSSDFMNFDFDQVSCKSTRSTMRLDSRSDRQFSANATITSCAGRYASTTREGDVTEVRMESSLCQHSLSADYCLCAFIPNLACSWDPS